MLSRALLLLAAAQSVHASVTVCAKSAKLFKCNGKTPYGWDAFPYIRFNGRLHKVCDGDALLGSYSYVRYDDSTPTWNMCCTWPGTKELFSSFDVQILDRELLKNIELGTEQYTKLPEPGETLELEQELGSSSLLGKLQLALHKGGKSNGLYSATGSCHYGSASLTVSVDWSPESTLSALLRYRSQGVVGEAEPRAIPRGQQPFLLAAAVLGVGAMVAVAANFAATRLRAML